MRRGMPDHSDGPLGSKNGLDDLAGELVKDRVYFEQSGGGVTLSGGKQPCSSIHLRSL